MALDNIAGIKSISVPTWLKLLIFGIVVTVLIADLALVWTAATNPKHKDWFSVAVQLLGSLVPMLLVILLLAFATRGPESIYRKTSYLLLQVIPATIVNSLTWSPDFEALEKAQRKRPAVQICGLRSLIVPAISAVSTGSRFHSFTPILPGSVSYFWWLNSRYGRRTCICASRRRPLPASVKRAA